MKAFMESRFNCYFGIIKIYYDVRASCQINQVSKFTSIHIWKHIPFGDGQYIPIFWNRKYPRHKLTQAVQED
jgi:hypothetical protein